MSNCTKSQNWFEKNCKEDQQDIAVIAGICEKELFDKLSITVKSEDIIMATYGVIFNTIMNYVKEQQDTCDTYSINIADRLEVGYTNRDDESQEKVGNFMIYMKCLEGASQEQEIDEEESRSIELAAQWNAANITSNIEAIKEISQRAYKALDEEVDISLGSLELVMPIFCIIQESICSYVNIKRVELDEEEYEVNICNLCYVGSQVDEEANAYTYMRPTVAGKREFKNDKVAGKDSEEDAE